MHSFGLIVALKQSYLAETCRITKFLLYEEKFNRIAVAVITLFAFGKQDQGIIISIPRRGGNYVVFCFV